MMRGWTLLVLAIFNIWILDSWREKSRNVDYKLIFSIKKMAYLLGELNIKGMTKTALN